MVELISSIQGGDMIRRKYPGNIHMKSRQAKRFRQEMTESEKALWSRLRGNRLLGLHFRRQHVIRGFIVDFYCHEVTLIVEIDGSVHEMKAESDHMRDAILISDGLTVLHLPAGEVERNLDGVLKIIEQKCQEFTSKGLQNTDSPIA